MKKLLVIMAAMLVTVASFAQMPVKKAVLDKHVKQYTVKDLPVRSSNHSKNADASFWFSYIEALYNYMGEDLSPVSANPLQCDTLGIKHYSDGDGRPYFLSFGQVYDLTHPCWTDFYAFNEAYEDAIVPSLGESQDYSIDSVMLLASYERGTNVPESVVDTLIVSYVLGMDGFVYYLGNPYSYICPLLPYNSNTYTPDYNYDPQSGLPEPSLPDETIIINQKIPLTVADAADPEQNFLQFLAYECPAELQHIDKKSFAIIVTFVPGCERDLNSVIGEDLNSFEITFKEEIREEYKNPGSPELLADYQCGLFTDPSTLHLDTEMPLWYHLYEPSFFFTDYYFRPCIYFKATCTDCALVNVEDAEAENMTVYPNPATNSIKVNLSADGEANIQMFNLVGQLVYSENAMNTATIDVSGLNAGIYMLKVNQNGKVYTSKVVVK